MTQALHSQARTTHLIREEIKNSTLPQVELARLYNITRQTIGNGKIATAGRRLSLSEDAQDDAHARAGADRGGAAHNLVAAHGRPAVSHARIHQSSRFTRRPGTLPSPPWLV